MIQSESTQFTSPTKEATVPQLHVAAGPGGEPQLAQLSPARVAWVQSVALVLHHKKLILAVMIVVTTVTGIIAFNQPNVFTSTAVILPPRKAGNSMLDGIASGLSSTIRDLGITRLAGGSEGGAYTPLSLVHSRELRRQLINEFKLVDRYEVPNIEMAEQELALHLSANTTEFASFTVSFTDEDPKFAAQVANRTVELMNGTSSRLAKMEAAQNRANVEKRYLKCIADLDSAESALGRFQREYGVYSMPDQAKSQASAIATLEQQRYGFELQMKMAEQLYGSQSPEYATFKASAAEITSKLGELRVSSDENSSFVATDLLPDVALDYLRTMREVEIQSKLKAFLLPAFEQAKLDETKESVAFLTLDPATPPMRKSGPKRSVMLLIAMIGSFVATSVVVLYYYRLQHARVRFTADKRFLGLK